MAHQTICCSDQADDVKMGGVSKRAVLNFEKDKMHKDWGQQLCGLVRFHHVVYRFRAELEDHVNTQHSADTGRQCPICLMVTASLSHPKQAKLATSMRCARELSHLFFLGRARL